jgi:hypothetical protein
LGHPGSLLTGSDRHGLRDTHDEQRSYRGRR